MRERVARAFDGIQIDSDVLDELAQHAESTYDALIADGTTEQAALTKIDQLIDGWRVDPASLRRVIKRPAAVTPPSPSGSIVTGSWADLVYGARLLRSRPAHASTMILTIALGVAALTTLFSVTDGVLLRPLTWASGDGLVRVIESRGGRQARVPGTMMNGSYLAWADAPSTIESIGAWTGGALTLTGHGDATRLTVTNVTPSLFDVLRAKPIRGRTFLPAEGRDGNWKFVLLSEGIWEQRFGRREDLIGQSITLDGFACTIVGIMPRTFQFPTSETQLWLPFGVAAIDGPNGVKRGQIFGALARLVPGRTAAQAAAEATARATAAADAGPVGMSLFGANTPIQVNVVGANEAATAEVRAAILVLLLAAGLLYATAIANVANMQLARAVARRRELMIRAALGAGSGRLSRQLLIESGLISGIGAASGVLLTFALHRVLPSLLPAGFPRADEIAVDARVLGFAVVLAVLTGVIAAVLPVLYSRRMDLTRALAEGSLAASGNVRGGAATARLIIVGSQVTVTSMLLVGGVILTRSFLAQTNADRGYDPANVLTATVPFPGGYTFEQRQHARDRILERLKARPGITHAAFSTGVPLVSAGGFASFNFASPTRSGVEVQAETIRRVITPDYFGALGIRLVAGRPLLATDTLGGPTAVVVNRSFVRKFLDDVAPERAVGMSLGTVAVRGTEPDRREATIVGVTNDMRQDSVAAPEQPEMFVAVAQLKEPQLGPAAIVVVRTIGQPSTYVEAVRSAVREEDASIALDAVMTLEQRVSDSLSRPRVYAVLLGGFASIALIIAATGLFAVLSYSVTQRSRELAVRSALGASRGEVVRVALKQIAVAMVAGLAAGTAASSVVSTQLGPFIYGVSTRDAISFGVAPLILLIAGVIACIVPARRVARTNPVEVLREV